MPFNIIQLHVNGVLFGGIPSIQLTQLPNLHAEHRIKLVNHGTIVLCGAGDTASFFDDLKI